MILIMPLPQILATMMMAMAHSASHQLVEALVTAVPDRFRPMRMMMGPVTMGGKNRMTFLAPTSLNSSASTRYSRPATTTPPSA